MVWVRGRRPCPLRAAQEAALRGRLASVSALFAKVGVKPVTVRAASLELAADARTHGLWAVPAKYLRGRLERRLARAHQRAAARVAAARAAAARLWGLPLRLLQQALPPALLGSLAPAPATLAAVAAAAVSGASNSTASQASAAKLSVGDEAKSLAAWREEFEFVLVASQSGADGGELSNVQLFKQV
jgi:hypothetical protein